MYQNIFLSGTFTFSSFWILTIIFILIWVLIVSSIKIVFFIIFMGMVENAHQWMWIYSIAIHTFFFAIIFECLRWSPCALNSWVVNLSTCRSRDSTHLKIIISFKKWPRFFKTKSSKSLFGVILLACSCEHRFTRPYFFLFFACDLKKIHLFNDSDNLETSLYNVWDNFRYSLVVNFKDNFDDNLMEVWWTT